LLKQAIRKLFLYANNRPEDNALLTTTAILDAVE